MKLKRPIVIGCEGGDVLAVERGLRSWSEGVSPNPDGVYEQRDADRASAFQKAEKIKPASGKVGQQTLDALWPYIDPYGKLRYRLYRAPKPLVIELGPVVPGGDSVLAHDLTHATAGIPLYPAFDDAFSQGLTVIAPENMQATRTSSSNPGLAFYATGESKIRYWFAHLDRTHSNAKFNRGDFIGRVGPNHIGGGPHCHVGINVELLLGRGVELEHHTDYSHGAPTVGRQLERASL